MTDFNPEGFGEVLYNVVEAYFANQLNIITAHASVTVKGGPYGAAEITAEAWGRKAFDVNSPLTWEQQRQQFYIELLEQANEAAMAQLNETLEQLEDDGVLNSGSSTVTTPTTSVSVSSRSSSVGQAQDNQSSATRITPTGGGRAWGALKWEPRADDCVSGDVFRVFSREGAVSYTDRGTKFFQFDIATSKYSNLKVFVNSNGEWVAPSNVASILPPAGNNGVGPTSLNGTYALDVEVVERGGRKYFNVINAEPVNSVPANLPVPNDVQPQQVQQANVSTEAGDSNDEWDDWSDLAGADDEPPF